MDFKERLYMDMNEKLELLGRAFANGEVEELSGALLKECKYYSGYAHRSLTSAEQILESVRKVYQAVQNDENDCSYTYKIIELKTIMNDGVNLDDLHGNSSFDVCENGLLI